MILPFLFMLTLLGKHNGVGQYSRQTCKMEMLSEMELPRATRHPRAVPIQCPQKLGSLCPEYYSAQLPPNSNERPKESLILENGLLLV